MSRIDRSGRDLPHRSEGAPWAHSFRLATLLVAGWLLTWPAFAGAPGPEPEHFVEGADDAPTSTIAPLPPAEPEPEPLPVMSNVLPLRDAAPIATRPVLDPAARLLRGDEASEAWTLYVELESGHRITQRFLLTNAGPGEHNAVAVGHLVEPGRAPYRYENGRRRSRWTLSEDRLFFDIAASHLDLHRPKGELRITKDDIEIRMFFDFAATAPSARIPSAHLPPDYHVEVLAIGARTTGSILAPWMSAPLETRGRTWLVHSWSERAEAKLVDRRVEVYGHSGETSFYGIHIVSPRDSESAWSIVTSASRQIIESEINIEPKWQETILSSRKGYEKPERFDVSDSGRSGAITLGQEWLRFDPLEVIPQPFRWFIRRGSKPQEVWANAQIGVSLLSAPEDPPSLPPISGNANQATGETTSNERVTEASHESDVPREWETASRSVTGVASITFLNPVSRR